MKGVVVAGALLLLSGAVFSQASRPVDSERKSPAGSREKQDLESRKTPRNGVVVYYFHGNARCRRCRLMEAYAAEALKSGFPKELESGKLVWRQVNTDREENRHFISDYELVTKSLVLSEVRKGKEKRWKNLKEVWHLVSDKAAYIKFVQDETRAYLKGKK